MLKKKKILNPSCERPEHFVEQENFRCLAHQGQIYSFVSVWAEWKCVTICAYVLSRTHQHPFTLLEKLFMSYLSWSQGSVKSKPCRSSQHCPALCARPRPSSALWVSTCSSLSLIEPQLVRVYCVQTVPHWKTTLKLTVEAVQQGKTYWVSYCFLFLLLDWWTPRVTWCLCFAALVFCTRGQKLFQTHDVHRRGSSSLWALFIWALVLWIPPPPVTFYSSQFVPHCWCLGCFDAFYLEMTINFTLLLFFNINIYIQVSVNFSACVAIYGYCCCFCEYSCWLLILLLYPGFGCNFIERFFPVLVQSCFFYYYYLNKHKNNATCCLFITVSFILKARNEEKGRNVCAIEQVDPPRPPPNSFFPFFTRASKPFPNSIPFVSSCQPCNW